jgi:hypothetical protein
MFEGKTDELGGEKAGEVKISMTLNNGASSTAGAANPLATRWLNEEDCTSGTRKSSVQPADTARLGAGCWWQGGSVGLRSPAAHNATHCMTPKSSITMSRATTGERGNGIHRDHNMLPSP